MAKSLDNEQGRGTLMGKWTEAPDGQPTENIELQLRTAEEKLHESLKWRDECEKKLESATWLVGRYGGDRDRLDWQLEQRKKREEDIV